MDAQSRRRRLRGLEARAGPLSALLQGQGCPSAQAGMWRRRTTRHRAWRGPGRRPGRIGACLALRAGQRSPTWQPSCPHQAPQRLPPPRAPWTRGPARKRHPAPADREHRRADQACTQVPSRAARSPPAPVRHTKRRCQTMSDCPVDSHAGFSHGDRSGSWSADAGQTKSISRSRAPRRAWHANSPASRSAGGVDRAGASLDNVSPSDQRLPQCPPTAARPGTVIERESGAERLAALATEVRPGNRKVAGRVAHR